MKLQFLRKRKRKQTLNEINVFRSGIGISVTRHEFGRMVSEDEVYTEKHVKIMNTYL